MKSLTRIVITSSCHPHSHSDKTHVPQSFSNTWVRPAVRMTP